MLYLFGASVRVWLPLLPSQLSDVPSAVICTEPVVAAMSTGRPLRSLRAWAAPAEGGWVPAIPGLLALLLGSGFFWLGGGRHSWLLTESCNPCVSLVVLWVPGFAQDPRVVGKRLGLS